MDGRDTDDASAPRGFEPHHWVDPFEPLETDMKKIVDALNEPKILAAVLTVLYAVTIALAFAIAGPRKADAGDRPYKPLESVEGTIGAERAGAVHLARDQGCVMNLMVEEAGFGDPAARPSAARIRVSLNDGSVVDVGGGNRDSMQFTCARPAGEAVDGRAPMMALAGE